MPGEGFQGPRCGARTRSGGSCEQPAMENGRCRMHGGKSLKGFAHPNYRHGRYSDFMPQKLLAAYSRQIADPDLLQQRDEIALVDSLIIEALERVDTGESGQLWRRLKSAWAELSSTNDRASRVGLDPDERNALMRRSAELLEGVGEMIQRGARDAQIRDELLHLVDRKRRLVESQSKREVLEKDFISREDALHLLHDTAEAVRAEVRDRATLAAIAARYELIIGRVEPLQNETN